MMMRNLGIGLATLCLSGVAMADGVSQEVPGHGKVNFTDNTITVTGSGAPDLKAPNAAVARLGAERAAKLDALRNIIETVKGVKVSGTETAKGSVTMAKLQGMVRRFKVLDTKYYSDGGVDLIVEVPLSEVTDVVVAGVGSKTASGGGGSHTGVIINAKGLKASPGLAPRVVDEKGGEVFAASNVNKAAAKSAGVCGYNDSVEAAKRDNRVGSNPLVIKAVRLTAKGSADLVVSDADAGKVKKLGAALAKGSVVIVTD